MKKTGEQLLVSDRFTLIPHIESTELRQRLALALLQLEQGKIISGQDLMLLHVDYPQGLLNGRPTDPTTLSSVFAYILDRLPTQVLLPDSRLHLCSDTHTIMSVPHTLEVQGNTGLYRKRTPARARWVIVDNRHENHLIFHDRDINPDTPTDGIEILSWLATLEQVRITAHELLSKHIDVSPLLDVFIRSYVKHRKAQVEMIEKRLLAILPDDQRELLVQKLEIAKEKLRTEEAVAYALFYDWISNPSCNFSLSTHPEYPFHFIQTLPDEATSAPEITVNLIENEITRLNHRKVTDVLFGNDFSLRIFLVIGLFSEAEWQKLEVFFKDSLSQVQTKLHSIENLEIRETAKKFFLAQQLAQYKGNDPTIISRQKDIFSPFVFKNLGITRLVPTSKSPFADPIDVLDFNALDPHIFARLPAHIQSIIAKLRDKDRVILSIPYALGDLTATTAQVLLSHIQGIRSVAFVGKVGHPTDGNDNISVGDVVLPRTTLDQFGNIALDVPNTLTKEHIEKLGVTPIITTNVSTKALTFQTPLEIEQEIRNGTCFSLDVELYHLIEMFNFLPKDVRESLALILCYYISDTTVLSSEYDEERHHKDKITSLGVRGPIPLYLSMLSTLERMAEI